MGLQRYIVNFPRLSRGLLEVWRTVPSRIASDALGRAQAVEPGVRACAPGMRLCGQARTVAPMPGDNSVLMTACSLAEPGDVVVVGGTGGGAGLATVAVAGEWVTRSCKSRGLGGLVIDGAVRDLPEIRTLGFPVFAKGAVPRAPHKSIGGKMDLPVMAGGVAVSPGDLIIGDDDGVAVVPLASAEEALKRCLERMDRAPLVSPLGTEEHPGPAPIASPLPLLTALGLPDADRLELPAAH